MWRWPGGGGGEVAWSGGHEHKAYGGKPWCRRWRAKARADGRLSLMLGLDIPLCRPPLAAVRTLMQLPD